ncbi:MAG: IPT/TIG domain-containing protein [Terriglobia bacterium]
MKNLRASTRSKANDLRFWIAGAAIICLALSLSACGGAGNGTLQFGSTQPVINLIQPVSGSTAGGTLVTIFGSNFESGAAVTFGGDTATNINVLGPAQITCVTPAHSAGTVTVTVTNPDGGSGSLSNGYAYNVAPTITSITPIVGSIIGGTSVTIVGTGFQTGATVSFGGAAATIATVTTTQITLTTPAHAPGTVNVTVTNPDGSSVTQTGGFTYGLPPSITSVTPNSGPDGGGTIVTITGAEFQQGATVKFGSGMATNVVVSSSAQTIQATTPVQGPGTVDVTVTNPDGRSATLKSGFTYTGTLIVTAIAPNTGTTAGGTAVTITGTPFAPGALVYFGNLGGTQATNVVVVGSTQITCNTPAHAAGAVDVTVVVGTDNATLSGGYTYTASSGVTIGNIDPPSGTTAGGTVVAIIGSGFQQNLTVTFGTAAGTQITVTPDGTQITVTTPAHAAGSVDVVVNNPDGSSATAKNGYTYGNPAPTISSISPTSGPLAGGTVVTINGSNFLNGATVTFGGVAATAVTFVSSSQLTATTPASSNPATVDIKVTNPDGQSATLSGAFTYGTTAIQIVTTTLVDGNPTVPYYVTLLLSGGAPPYTWSISSGQIPAGLSLNASTGVISGTPTTLGLSNFTAQVTDSLSETATAGLAISIETPPLAAIPQTFLDTTFPDTTGYTVTTLGPSDNFQAALNSAASACATQGQVLRLNSGATYSKTGGFTLPQTSCAAGKWIIIRTDTADSNLPPADTRIDPTYSPILAKIISNTNGVSPISTASNASHYWFMGVEIGVGASVSTNYGIFVVGNGETDPTLLPDHIYVDRCYIHGNPTGNIQRGYGMNGASLAIVNSYVENIHNVGSDAQAVAAWNTFGPLKVVNNYLEASGENILWGGAKVSIAQVIPSDIEIRRNHLIKSLTWYVNDPSYGGIHFEVKNWLEFKDAQRALVEGNVFEYNWADAQVGYGLVFTPRTSHSGTNCSACTVADITIRYNLIRHTSSGFDIAGEDNQQPPSQPSQRITIHDNLLIDVENTTWGGDGKLLEFVNGGSGQGLLTPHDVTYDHNTAFQNSVAVVVGSDENNLISNFIFTNNIQPYDTYGISGSSTSPGKASLDAYFQNYTVTNDVLDAPPSGFKSSTYPPGNFYPPDFSQQSVGFVDFAGGDFRLCTPALCNGFTSPFADSGTDGEDMGADVSAINAATAGVIP